MDHLDAQRAVLRHAFDHVPEALRDRQPMPGRWAVAGVIEHLAIVEERVAGALSARIAQARAEGLGAEVSSAPVVPTFNLARVTSRDQPVNAPEATRPKGVTAAEAWSHLERSGAAVRDTLRQADGLALGTIMHPHPLFGPLSIYEWFAVIGSHEARHAAQIREIGASM